MNGHASHESDQKVINMQKAVDTIKNYLSNNPVDPAKVELHQKKIKSRRLG